MKLKLKHVLIFNAIVAFVNGLGILIMPEPFSTSMGFSLTADGITAVRFFATVIFGLGILMLGIRNEPHSYMRQVVLIMLLWNFAAMALIFLIWCDLSNFMIWFNIVLNFALVGGYGYFFLKNRGK